MTDKPISEAAKLRACELANAIRKHPSYWKVTDIGNAGHSAITAFARYIDQVSDAAEVGHKFIVEQAGNVPGSFEAAACLLPIILPPHDPLEEAKSEAMKAARVRWANVGDKPTMAELYDAELAKRGLRIVEAGDD